MLPWKESSSESERLLFIRRWNEGDESVADLSRQFGISRKTGYKMIGRYQREREVCGPQQGAPPPSQRHAELAERIIGMKLSRPRWGPKKLIGAPHRPGRAWPSPSTAGVAVPLVKRRKRRRRSTPWSEPFAAAEEPNDVWSIDFKGWFRTGDGSRIDPLTTQDAASRYLLVCGTPTPGRR